MKKIKVLTKAGLMCLWVLLLVYETAQAQCPYTGKWEGDFMDQFKTVILLDQLEENGYAGKIIMFSGENRIQDDEISRITIEDSKLSFYIAAKESSFKGTFNEANTELSGHFIFPDDSRHPLTVSKYEKDSAAVEANTPSLKENLKQSFPVEELKSDFRDLIDKLKKYHPRLYSYTPEIAFDNRAKLILAGLKDDLNMEQFYVRIAPLLASVHCSHTGIRLPWNYQLSLHESAQYFPLEIYVKDKRAYCLSAPASTEMHLVPGSEILSINNRPVNQIIEELLSLIPSEGNCMTGKYQLLNGDFPGYFHMLDPSEDFRIEFPNVNSKGFVQMEACSYEMLVGMLESPLPQRSFSFSIDKDPELGKLKISSFGIRNMEEYFAFLDSTFRLMEDVPNLLLDLRDNQGGHPIFAAQLFSYLCDTEFTYFKKNPDVEEFEPLYHVMEPNQLNYKGNIFVLVNGGCLSTTGHLISLLKYYTGALFIGEEPGSTFICNDMSIQLKLPHTGMEVNIPRTTFETAVSGFREEEAFPLDFEVDISIEDLLKGTDTYRAKVDELLAEKQTLNL